MCRNLPLYRIRATINGFRQTKQTERLSKSINKNLITDVTLTAVKNVSCQKLSRGTNSRFRGWGLSDVGDILRKIFFFRRFTENNL